MKRIDLIRSLEQAGCLLIRRGVRHDWYNNPKTGTIPRHREIADLLAKHILRKLGIE